MIFSLWSLVQSPRNTGDKVSQWATVSRTHLKIQCCANHQTFHLWLHLNQTVSSPWGWTVRGGTTTNHRTRFRLECWSIFYTFTCRTRTETTRRHTSHCAPVCSVNTCCGKFGSCLKTKRMCRNFSLPEIFSFLPVSWLPGSVEREVRSVLKRAWAASVSDSRADTIHSRERIYLMFLNSESFRRRTKGKVMSYLNNYS